jgi:ssRNA-specific RNase YbeY (16S rRNA maturation enzyme)
LALLTVHGVLHLLDHDHDTPVHHTQMWEAQARILLRLGSPVTLP